MSVHPPDPEEVRQRVENAARLSASYVGLTGEDVEALHREAPRVEPHFPQVVARVTDSLLGDPEARRVVESSGLSRERAEKLFEDWLRYVFRGDYGASHALMVFRIGLAHVRAGVDERLMICNMGAFARELLPLVEDGMPLMKALIWNLSVMIFSYEYVKDLVFREATGISGGLVDRLIKLYTEKLYQTLRVASQG